MVRISGRMHQKPLDVAAILKVRLSCSLTQDTFLIQEQFLGVRVHETLPSTHSLAPQFSPITLREPLIHPTRTSSDLFQQLLGPTLLKLAMHNTSRSERLQTWSTLLKLTIPQRSQESCLLRSHPLSPRTARTHGKSHKVCKRTSDLSLLWSLSKHSLLSSGTSCLRI